MSREAFVSMACALCACGKHKYTKLEGENVVSELQRPVHLPNRVHCLQEGEDDGTRQLWRRLRSSLVGFSCPMRAFLCALKPSEAAMPSAMLAVHGSGRVCSPQGRIMSFGEYCVGVRLREQIRNPAFACFSKSVLMASASSVCTAQRYPVQCASLILFTHVLYRDF